MDTVSSEPFFFVWGSNYTPYGPVELGTLVTLVKDARVTADTWVFTTQGGTWSKAAQVPELRWLFGVRLNAGHQELSASDALSPNELRRIHVLSRFTDQQLEDFSKYVAVRIVPEMTIVVRQGEPGDSMFLIYDGELRVRIMAMGQEITLATLGQGDFFGDISLFDPGPRSADVLASKPSTLLCISSAAFNRLARQSPDVATPFLLEIGKILTTRIRADNTRWSVGRAVRKL